MNALKWSQHLFGRCSRTANSVVGDGIWQKFKLIQAFMVFLVTCKNDEDPYKNEHTSAHKHFSHYVYGNFPWHSRAANSAVSCWISLNFKPVRDIMFVLVTWKNEEDLNSNGGAWVLIRFPHYNPMGPICCHGNQSSDPIWLKPVCSLIPTPVILQMKLNFNRTAGLRDFMFERVNGQMHTSSSPIL